MARRKKRLRWRRGFLRGLGMTANVRQAAREAGIDHRTAYDHRKKCPPFARAWTRMLGIGEARVEGGHSSQPRSRLPDGSRPRSGRGSTELVIRHSKHCGTQLVRAGKGRWHSGAEAGFLAELARTGCVTWAADSCGFSTTALYKRRAAHPDFAEKWRATEALAKERLPGLLVAASIASFDPEVETEGLPPVNVDQAIAIARLKCCGGGEDSRGPRGRSVRRERSIEEVRDEVVRRIAAIRRHREEPDGEAG